MQAAVFWRRLWRRWQARRRAARRLGARGERLACRWLRRAGIARRGGWSAQPDGGARYCRRARASVGVRRGEDAANPRGRPPGRGGGMEETAPIDSTGPGLHETPRPARVPDAFRHLGGDLAQRRLAGPPSSITRRPSSPRAAGRCSVDRQASSPDSSLRRRLSLLDQRLPPLAGGDKQPGSRKV